MSRVNHEGEIIITGKIRHRMIKSKVNSFLGGKFWRINYPEEKVWGKDGAQPTKVITKALLFFLVASSWNMKTSGLWTLMPC